MAKLNTEGKVQTIEGNLTHSLAGATLSSSLKFLQLITIRWTFLTSHNLELQLYLIILLGQKERHVDALALLEGEIGIKTKAVENVELRHLRIELLIKAGRWKDARDAAMQILKEIKYVDHQ